MLFYPGLEKKSLLFEAVELYPDLFQIAPFPKILSNVNVFGLICINNWNIIKNILCIVIKLETKVSAEEFQFWKLTVNLSENTGTLICEDGNGLNVYAQRIEYTDCPLNEIKFYLVDNVLMLPSEY